MKSSNDPIAADLLYLWIISSLFRAFSSMENNTGMQHQSFPLKLQNMNPSIFPVSPDDIVLLVSYLIHTHNVPLVLDAFDRYYPEHPFIHFLQFLLSLKSGQPHKALHSLEIFFQLGRVEWSEEQDDEEEEEEADEESENESEDEEENNTDKNQAKNDKDDDKLNAPDEQDNPPSPLRPKSLDEDQTNSHSEGKDDTVDLFLTSKIWMKSLAMQCLVEILSDHFTLDMIHKLNRIPFLDQANPKDTESSESTYSISLKQPVNNILPDSFLSYLEHFPHSSSPLPPSTHTFRSILIHPISLSPSFLLSLSRMCEQFLDDTIFSPFHKHFENLTNKQETPPVTAASPQPTQSVSLPVVRKKPQRFIVNFQQSPKQKHNIITNARFSSSSSILSTLHIPNLNKALSIIHNSTELPDNQLIQVVTTLVNSAARTSLSTSSSLLINAPLLWQVLCDIILSRQRNPIIGSLLLLSFTYPVPSPNTPHGVVGNCVVRGLPDMSVEIRLFIMALAERILIATEDEIWIKEQIKQAENEPQSELIPIGFAPIPGQSLVGTTFQNLDPSQSFTNNLASSLSLASSFAQSYFTTPARRSSLMSQTPAQKAEKVHPRHALISSIQNELVLRASALSARIELPPNCFPRLFVQSKKQPNGGVDPSASPTPEQANADPASFLPSSESLENGIGFLLSHGLFSTAEEIIRRWKVASTQANHTNQNCYTLLTAQWALAIGKGKAKQDMKSLNQAVRQCLRKLDSLRTSSARRSALHSETELSLQAFFSHIPTSQRLVPQLTIVPSPSIDPSVKVMLSHSSLLSLSFHHSLPSSASFFICTFVCYHVSRSLSLPFDLVFSAPPFIVIHLLLTAPTSTRPQTKAAHTSDQFSSPLKENAFSSQDTSSSETVAHFTDRINLIRLFALAKKIKPEDLSKVVVDSLCVSMNVEQMKNLKRIQRDRWDSNEIGFVEPRTRVVKEEFGSPAELGFSSLSTSPRQAARSDDYVIQLVPNPHPLRKTKFVDEEDKVESMKESEDLAEDSDGAGSTTATFHHYPSSPSVASLPHLTPLSTPPQTYNSFSQPPSFDPHVNMNTPPRLLDVHPSSVLYLLTSSPYHTTPFFTIFSSLLTDLSVFSADLLFRVYQHSPFSQTHSHVEIKEVQSPPEDIGEPLARTKTLLHLKRTQWFGTDEEVFEIETDTNEETTEGENDQERGARSRQDASLILSGLTLRTSRSPASATQFPSRPSKPSPTMASPVRRIPRESSGDRHDNSSDHSPMRLVSDSATGGHSYSIETPLSRSFARGGLDTPLRLGSPSISEDLPPQFASPVKVKSVSDLHDFSVALYCQEWDSVNHYGPTYLASRHDVTVPFPIQLHEKSVFPEDCNPELCTPTEVLRRGRTATLSRQFFSPLTQNDSGSDSQISDPAFVSSFFFPLLLTNRVDLLCLAYNTASDQKLQRIVRSSLRTIAHEAVEEREFSILIRILTIIQDPTVFSFIPTLLLNHNKLLLLQTLPSEKHPRLKCMLRNFLSNHSEKSSRSSRQKRAAPNTTKEPHQPVLPQPETSKLVKGGGHAAVGHSPRRHRSGTESQLVLPVQHINQLSEFIEINYQQFFLHPASIINLTRALLNMLLMDSIKNNRPVSKAEAEDDDVSTLLTILTQPDRSAQNTSTAQNALVTENGVTPKTVFRGLIAVIQRLLSASFLLTQAHSTILVASLNSLIHSLFVVSKYPQAQWSALRLLAHHRSFIPPPSRAIHTVKAQLQASPGVQKQTTSLPTSIILPASFHPSFLDTHLIHQHQLLNIQSSEHSPSTNFTPFRPISNHNTQMFSLTPLSHPATMESIPLVASLDTLSIDPPSFNPTEDAFLFSFLRAMTEMVIHNSKLYNSELDQYDEDQQDIERELAHFAQGSPTGKQTPPHPGTPDSSASKQAPLRSTIQRKKNKAAPKFALGKGYSLPKKIVPSFGHFVPSREILSTPSLFRAFNLLYPPTTPLSFATSNLSPLSVTCNIPSFSDHSVIPHSLFPILIAELSAFLIPFSSFFSSDPWGYFLFHYAIERKTPGVIPIFQSVFPSSTIALQQMVERTVERCRQEEWRVVSAERAKHLKDDSVTQSEHPPASFKLSSLGQSAELLKKALDAINSPRLACLISEASIGKLPDGRNILNEITMKFDEGQVERLELFVSQFPLFG
ncbi:hypothetical protein BLNAU_8821 [Blattamonas nauphoetae]|uniref:Uncharacterized protein n=1 Tax=Blattamonas nauphoetae TaxID=2049346 RepID=A0ABQ9XXS9_9EUKA|nr:hypothetical protein BLNAU_8821 [Blattamonas nauphoetae]